MLKKITLILTICFLFTAFLSAQTFQISPYGVSPRVVGIDSTDIFDRAYNGLQNVGVGTKVYLKFFSTDGFAATPFWTVQEMPTGSTVEASRTDPYSEEITSEVRGFILDLPGKYVFQANDQGESTTIALNAGTYVGFESGSPSCMGCHNNAAFDNVGDEWAKTGHADMLNRGLDGSLSSHYGEGCISCHTTGYDLDANNNGFDDRDFVWPDTLNESTWDSLLISSPMAMQLANIQCEACHGPGSGHDGELDDFRMQKTLSPDNCAYCHDDGHYHVFPEQFAASSHANLDAPYTRSSCAPCHNGAGFVAYIQGGKQNLSSDMPENVNITCAACHDPHEVNIEHQLRTVSTTLGDGFEVTSADAGYGGLCMNCHKSRRDGVDYATNYLDHLSSHYGPHHGPQADLLIGTNVYTYEKELPSSNHYSATPDACVTCHMANALVDAEHNQLLAGGHSFSMSTIDDVDNMTACQDCHPDYTTSFEDITFSANGTRDLDGDGVGNGLQAEVQGMLDSIKTMLPPVGSLDVNTIDSSWTSAQGIAYYNHEFVREDKSLGIHNPAFVVALLQSALDDLRGTTTPTSDNYYVGSVEENCATCHESEALGGTQLTEWKETKHAIAQDSLAFLEVYCLACHNTGYDPDVVNGGADEYVAVDTTAPFGWVVTDTENWDRINNVQCEACHGPLGQPDGSMVGGHTNEAVVDLSSESCGACHEGSHHPTYSNWAESVHAKSKFTTIPGAFEWIASNPGCAGCHTAEGFLQFLESDDLEPHVVAPGPEGNDITCAACHDPHGGPFEGQLRMAPEELCQKCHNPEYNPDELGEPDGHAVHHSTAWMLEGKGGYEYEGFTYESSFHTGIQEKCVRCHVHMTPYESEEIPAFTGHTFDPTLESCEPCHTLENFDYKGVQTEITDLLTTLGDKLAAASASDSTSNNFYRALFNHDYVSADGSHGVHNTKYARELLTSAIANFTPTGVEQEEGIPVVYKLAQNYPNPFNPSTTIKFSIPKVSDVKITIFDAIGREVEELVNEQMDAGNYSLNWNATNLSSGIYLYRIETGSFVDIKKMILLK
jgi:predicted CXXCH cytochrome family protein